MSDSSVEILMVEDSESDIRLAQISFERARLMNALHVVTDGAAALQFLRKEGVYVDKPRPDIILLDLNLPKLSGHEVLKAIRGDESLKKIPVVVLTTSDSDEDVLKSYELHANCYITKPVQLNKFLNVVQSIEHFWVKVVKLPPNS